MKPALRLLSPISNSFMKGIKGLLKLLAIFPNILNRRKSTFAKSKARK